jgi:hypothetical protein
MITCNASRAPLASLLAIAVALVGTACGGSSATKTVTVTETAGAPSTSNVATATTAAPKTTKASSGGTVRLLGAPALIHTTDRFYLVAVRLVNTSSDMKTVTVQFDGLRGARVLDTETDVRTVQPGDGLAMSQLTLPKGTREVRASISVEDSLGIDDALVQSTKLVGKARFTRGQYGDCTMSVQVKNGSSKEIQLVGVYLVALHKGKIVSAGFTFPDVNPRLSALAKADFVPCAKRVDAVRAYVEG